jgi:chemotaxis protein MotB
MTRYLVYTLLAALSLGLASCVSYRKYEDLETSHNQLQADYKQAAEQVEAYKTETAQLRQRLADAEKQVVDLTAELAKQEQDYNQLDRTNRDLMDRYDRILKQNESMLQSATGEKQELTAQLILKEQELNRRERDLQALQSQLTAREQRVAELESAINEKDAKLKALREKVNQALLGFSTADLTVTEKNGKVYVSLSQNLLFPSGSKTINQQGKNAIAKLAQVLNANPDINVTVEGHTDTDGDADFNWDLSVGRATAVVKELTKGGVDPKRVTAAGRGEFFPVATNETAAGKSQNRRTEIILTPKLDALYELIGGQ